MKFGRRETLFADQNEMPANGNGSAGVMEAAAPALLAAPAQPQRARAANQLNAFLGTGCIYEGKLTFEGRVRIDGKFTGEIFSNDTLEIGPDAEIEAEIDVSTVIVAGRVMGNINARARCDLRAQGQVIGNITSPVVTMEEGVRFDGARSGRARGHAPGPDPRGGPGREHARSARLESPQRASSPRSVRPPEARPVANAALPKARSGVPRWIPERGGGTPSPACRQ